MSPDTERAAWALAADLLTEQEAAGTWQPDPDDPDAWGLERERIAYTLINPSHRPPQGGHHHPTKDTP